MATLTLLRPQLSFFFFHRENREVLLQLRVLLSSNRFIVHCTLFIGTALKNWSINFVCFWLVLCKHSVATGFTINCQFIFYCKNQPVYQFHPSEV